jgi:hypothetical protein
MKTEIHIPKPQAEKLFAAMRKNLPTGIYLTDHNGDNILMSVEMKLGENHIIEATAVMCRFDWVRLMEQIRPTDTKGTESITIDWYERTKYELIDDMKDYADELLAKIECFEIEVIELEK